MVLPSDVHWALRGWMRTHRVAASEAGGIILVSNLNGLLKLSGSPRRISAGERALIKESRSIRTAPGDLDKFLAQLALDDPDHPVGRRVYALLTNVCEALKSVDVIAFPHQGLGIRLGDELLDVVVQIHDASGLYALMRAEGFAAEPDWNSEPFRERQWPEN